MELQCGFDVRTGATVTKVSRGDVNPADAFMQMIYSVQKLGAAGFANHTEIRVEAWPESWNAEVPIQSFWYIGVYKGVGWTNAREDQTDYYNATGELVPIIKVKVPANQSEDYSFHYYADDQVISPPAFRELASSSTRKPYMVADVLPLQEYSCELRIVVA